jgi:hypothetical protein
MKKKTIATEEDDPLDREIEMKNPRPNPFARDYGRSRNIRILAPDLLEMFPDSHSMNEALRTLVAVAQRAVPRKVSARRVVAKKDRG